MYHILSIIILFSAFVKSYDLSLQLEQGETYTQSYNAIIKINQNINGIDQDIDTELFGSMEYVVEDFSDDVYTLKTSYKSLAMKMNSALGVMDFSSENSGTSGDIFSQAMGKMIGKPFYLKMRKNGTVEEVKGLEKVFKAMMESFDTLPEGQKKQIEAQLKQTYGEEAFKGSVEMMTAIYPSEKVSKNKEWKTSVRMASTMPGTMSNTFKLVETKKDYMTIEGASEIISDDDSTFVVVNGMETRTKMSGTMSSTIKIDPKTHWIMEATISQDLSGEVEIKDNPMAPGGMTFPMTFKQQMKVTN